MDSSPRYCAICGAANAPDATVCADCGYALDGPPGDEAITQPLPALHLLKGRYRLLEQIGQGGMGAVYRAEDTHLGNRLVAVKEMSARGFSPAELEAAIEAFQREALLLAQLSHPNLPHIYEQFSEGNHWYLVMDFIAGETLEAHLARAPGGRLPVQEVLQIGTQLATVLSYLHTRQPPIVFRDLKPANIMLTPDGRLYLIDFGIARFFKPGQTKDTIPFGSAGYAAPEQYGRAQTTPQADIYSLGATLHQLLSGTDPSQAPFVFAPLHLAGPDGLEPLIFQMVQTDKTQRPASMEEIRQALQMLATLPASAPAPGRAANTLPPATSSSPARGGGPPRRLWRKPRLPRPSLQGCIVAVVLVLFIGLIPLSVSLFSSVISGRGPSVVAAPTATPTPSPVPTDTPTLVPTDTPAATSTPTPFVNGAAEYLIDAGTGRTLYSAHIHDRLPIASTTKIMTAILAIEDGGNLDQIVPITQAELDEVPTGASVAQLVAGDDNITLRYLLYALMLPSGSDAAIVIAHTVAGSTASFVNMMNAKAQTLGLNDTHFTNPHGATEDANHYSSVADLVKLAQYAMNNATFAQIVQTQHFHLSAKTNRHAYPWDTTNQLLGTYPGADGIKTGSLPNWFCIIFSATRSGRRLIGAELGAPTPDLLYGDATRLLDLGFSS